VQLFKEVFSSAHGPGQAHSFVPGKNMFDSPKLREHGVKVMETIGKAVSNIDNPAKLKPVLMSLGKTHAIQHNVKDNQYDMIAAALIKTLEKRLGSAWTPPVAAAWSALYQDIASDMKEGAVVESNFVPSNKGVGAAATDDGLPSSQETLPSENEIPAPQETPASQELQRTWALLKEQGLEKVGISVFKGVFTTAPSILMLFPFRDELDVYDSASLKSHALKVMEALGQVVESSEDLSAIKPMLRTLGEKHAHFKIKEQHYAIFGKALLGAFEMHLGDQWTAESISSWENLMKEAASSMQETATNEATKHVQRTWKAVEEQGLEETGVLLFKEIFTSAPAALQLFPFKDELDVYSSPALKTHALGVMQTVGTAVSMLNDVPALVPVLKELGAKHVQYGVKDPHYAIVGKALLTTLENKLGDLWTEDVKTAWTETVSVVAATMKEGAAEGPAAATHNETPNQAVVRTWKMVEEQGLEENGVKLFREIFAAAPGALQLFPFKDEFDVYGSAALKAHALGVMKTVGTAVSMLDDLPALVPLLKNLGGKHLQYGVKDSHYNIVANALLSTLEKQLGPAWTDPVASAWKETFEVVAATMKEGAMEIPVQGLVVQRTWKEVQKQGLEANGILLFKEIFSAAPGALQLFPFKDELDLYNSPALKAHALGVMETVGTAVSMLDNLPALVPVLKDLGAKHVKYGVKDAHYRRWQGLAHNAGEAAWLPLDC